MFLAKLIIAISSANCAMVNVFDLGRSLVYTRCKNGPMTLPCGTPDYLLERYDRISRKYVSGRQGLILNNSPSCETLSNAFFVSVKTPRHTCFSSNMPSITSVTLCNCRGHECDVVNPNCESGIRCSRYS